MKRSIGLLISTCAALLVTQGCAGNTKNSEDYQEKGISINQSNPQSYDATPLPPPDGTFTSTHFSGSDNCARCHNGLRDSAGNDVSIEKSWSGSMMANAAKDPFWQAKVQSEIERNPHLTTVINEKCTKCHMPMAHTEAKYVKQEIEIFEDGFLNPENPHYDQAMSGVSCTLCHQIMDSETLGTLEGFSGAYQIESFANAVDRKIYGPYADVAPRPMQNNVEYTITPSLHIKESKLCASCHNLKTPFVDKEGNILTQTLADEFPEQMPYSEWEHSAFVDEQSCQDCHMRRVDGVRIASRPRWADTLRDNFAQHIFVGGNMLMLDILQSNSDTLGVTSPNLSATMYETEHMLKDAASLVIENAHIAQDALTFDLFIQSRTGHKLPTGFPSRRVIVHVVVTDAEGKIVFESGKVNADGSVAGVDSSENISNFTPHYDEITKAEQVQIYEAIMQNSDDEVTYTLLRAASYKKDNRLLPKGFDKFTAPSDINVVGSAGEDEDFTGGSDRITYAASGVSGQSYTIFAELLYQPLAYHFAKDLFQSNVAQAEKFAEMFEKSNYKTSQIASTVSTIRR